MKVAYVYFFEAYYSANATMHCIIAIYRYTLAAFGWWKTDEKLSIEWWLQKVLKQVQVSSFIRILPLSAYYLVKDPVVMCEAIKMNTHL